ncbi:DUF397 domain-containing protein [Streptomyces sp. CB03238]|uniref:DUF397 domain-containing protein n=1 Tax=Streptomyces sp. CB03238 TaxID=1907777 RepID=UPI000A11DA43|nr:DUF397 domain-containing protein [Streptomyces sp. CB03238]ORT54209.1 DUF397 domain-containing protein [Streptomyces sp. CB03238]
MTNSKPSADELARATFRKSSFSGAQNECVEVARVRSWACVRDSKRDGGPVLSVTRSAFATLTDAVRNGEM